MRQALPAPTPQTLERYCTICGKRITDHKRIVRKSRFCTDNCWNVDRTEQRRLAAARSCRLCGREKGKRRAKVTAAASA
jgi:hypothetical protein